MRAVDYIIKKRNGEKLQEQDIKELIAGYVSGDIPDYQISAFLMAVFFQGLDFEETWQLTNAMIASGIRFDFPEIEGIKVDKHSTGGVGDKVSLLLAPIAAACGCKIPMMSGRGLGHTGGTLDKLESVPGYRVFLTEDEVRKILADDGYVMMGQTEDFVPADKRMYALRDVTGTVESIPLITSSIMSKKIAEGSNALVLDLKCGSGAFMKNIDDAKKLAEYIVGTAKAAGLKIKVVISDMDQPLGRTIGNYNELLESAAALQGNGDERLMDLTYRLAGWMIVLSEKAATMEEAVDMAKKAVASGEAFKLFLQNIEHQGGDIDYVINPKKLYKYSKTIYAQKNGYIEEINSYDVGIASIYIGCGRRTKEDTIDHYAGIEVLKKVGDSVVKDEPIFTLFYNEGDIETAQKLLEKSIVISDNKPKKNEIIYEEN
ncbi:MAG: thymidine phosphorylase [Spirochaetales bacterium]|nr:thymidine phosphorylase [Spirochaetales bacterium]